MTLHFIIAGVLVVTSLLLIVPSAFMVSMGSYELLDKEVVDTIILLYRKYRNDGNTIMRINGHTQDFRRSLTVLVDWKEVETVDIKLNSAIEDSC